jgi:hypothetical protein
MKRISTAGWCIFIAIFICIAACSKEKKAGTAVKVKEKPLIEVLYDAAKFYANGGRTFNAPPGVLIDPGPELAGGNRPAATNTVRIRGVQQKGKSLAVITFNLPGSWLGSEKQRLGDLEVEIKELASCANKLIERERTGVSPKAETESCKTKEAIVNGMPGISITNAKAPHIEMSMSHVQ